MGIYDNVKKRKKLTSSTQDTQDLINQILSKNERLQGSTALPDFNVPAPDFSWVGKAANILSTGQKVSAKTVNDLLMEGQLPTMEEYKNMVNPETSYSYSDVLKNMGMKEGFGRTALGLGLDIFGDPLNYVPLAGVGKMVGKGLKLGEKLPVIGKGFSAATKAGEGIADWARVARKIMPFSDKGSAKVYTRSQGISGEAGQITEEMVKKYPDVFDLVHKIRPEMFKTIDEASELYGKKGFTRMMADMTPEEKTFTRAWNKYLKETGKEKVKMGTVKGLIGETTGAEQMSLLDSDVAQSLLKPGSVETFSKEMSYNPHYFTDEAKAYMKKMSGKPEEMQNVMSGMVKKFVPNVEKSRSFYGTINEANAKSMKDLGFKMFEDDPRKLVANYQMAFAKKKAQYNFINEIKGLTDDAGSPILKMTTSKAPSEGMVKLTGLPFGGNFETNPEVAKIINRVNGVFASDELTGKFLKMYDKALKAFKYSVTMPWPSFNFNNLMGAMFNNWIYDAGSFKELPDAIAYAFRKVNPNKIITAENGASMTFKEFADALTKRGAFNTFTKIETSPGILGVGNKLTKPIKDIAGKYATKFPNRIEDAVRSQLALRVFKKTGSLDDAARAVWRVHGNYTPEFLGQTEKEVLTRVFPFWRWMRTSVPFQLENLYKQTGKYAAMAKIENTIISPEERNKLPDSVRDKLILAKTAGPNGTTNVQTADLPVMDLAKYATAKGIAGSMSPFIKTPMELTFNKQLFTDQKIEDEEVPKEFRVSRVTNPLLTLPGIKQLAGVRDVQKENKLTGKMEPYQEVNSKLQYILSQLGPITSLSATTKRVQKELEAQGVDTNTAVTIAAAVKGIAFPIKTTNYNPTEEEYWKLNELNNKLQAIINYGIPRGMVKRKK